MSPPKTREEDEKPYRDSGYPAGPVSMGGGRVVDIYPSNCPLGLTGCKATAISCIQSVEHFVCNNPDCDRHWYD